MMMNKKPTYKDLELGIRRWKRTYLILVIILLGLLIISTYVGSQKDNLEKELRWCEYNNVPEVINGNLYIGYEDGVRVGYHQSYLNKSIWYRCVRDCGVIELE